MTPEEIQAMAKGLAEGQAVWYVLSACIGGAIAGLGTYLAEKGKNRATKEDIADITKKVKEVEDVFNRGLSDLNAHHQLRMVAAERRLQAHQEAYALWYEMRTQAHNRNEEVRAAAIEKCQDWFQKNCMFLGKNSQDAMVRSFWGAENYLELYCSGDREMADKAYGDLMSPGRPLFEEVDLPALVMKTASLGVDDAPSGSTPA